MNLLSSTTLFIALQNNNASFSVHDGISLLYPYQTTLKKEHQDRIQTLLKTLKIKSLPSTPVKSIITEQQSQDKKKFNIDDVSLSIPCGQREAKKSDFVDLPYQRNILANMIQAFNVGDICLIGKLFIYLLLNTKLFSFIIT